MKKVLFVLSLLVLFSMFSTFFAGDLFVSAASSLVTFKASSQSVDLNIDVLGPPSLVIISPKNATYLTNESLLLNYSVSGAESVWYQVDGSAEIFISNVSSFLYFNVSDGSHNLTISANNSFGTSASTVFFVANSTRFIILYEDSYKTNFSGESTDFYTFTLEELQELSGVILDNVNYGKILFNEVINVTDDKDHGVDNLVDLENNTNISFNRISLDPVELPNFNVSASLRLYNLTFVNPRILRDGEVCSESICTFENYSNGLLRFNVTRFSIYSAEETPGAAPPAEEGEAAAEGAPTYVSVCNPPYFFDGEKCCLDENNNRICDEEEAELEFPLPIIKKIPPRVRPFVIVLLFILIILVFIFIHNLFDLLKTGFRYLIGKKMKKTSENGNKELISS
ncbi:hypothetical protein A2685_02095 [Candidatus Woesebacteria bacterium RIFCSPHIGHO2_01_FULL_37_10]|uniref:Peptidase S59 domain-containing protein n=1 Tax=Candidatus Woesebacteria bacterium RIFCSPHIGHO2_01_FULL_37_10 TaxID=1802489 RepID=A0A1F7XT48_9BACT|nr:MAG: hypothetical protein A2685_02095 [Candidatus Woesebacteria bacterium RIFCSPHIGHO2_01_FULL_37_10]